jgi:acyl-CoA reductase-like NAD-dependent aldehyde dehydrogenase
MTAQVIDPVELRSVIGGELVTGVGEVQHDRNPADPDDVVATFRLISEADLQGAIGAAEHAQQDWAETSVQQRAEVLRVAGEQLEADRDQLTAELVREQGKPCAAAAAEVNRSIEILRYFAHEAYRAQGDLYASARSSERIFTTRIPIGVAGVITPWNVPMAIPAWKLAPALVYGNTVVWKPAPETPLVAYRIVQALQAAGLPDGVLNLVFIEPSMGERLLTDERVGAVSFTGSTRVGMHLQALGARHGTQVLAEMGGKNSAIVLADADLEYAATQIVIGATAWGGQRCTATATVLVERHVYKDLLDRIGRRIESLRVGDPRDPNTDIGPLVSSRQLTTVQSHLDDAVSEGATIAARAAATEDTSGHYFQPAVLVDVRPEHKIFSEEVFGPVLVVLPVADLDEAITMANRSRYGLSGAIFTNSLDAAMDAVRRFHVGVLHVNSETGGADTHVPFGGLKDSGTSHRELGALARDFYTKTKTVYITTVPGRSPAAAQTTEPGADR